MRTKNLLIIFTRNPVLGKVKTRLAKTIGDAKALEVYKLLLKQTKAATQDLPCDKVVMYSEEMIQNDLWDRTYYEKQVQFGFDLGTKMKNAFVMAFKNHYEKVVLIGSDLYDITPDLITAAFDQLTAHDAVIGPASDGGYYLIALKKIPPKVFKNKAWGTANVLQDTLKDLEKVDVHLLPELNDIDVFEDLQNHPAFSSFLTTQNTHL